MTLYSDYIQQGRRNVLFNGNFDLWPAGTSFPIAGGHNAGMMYFGDNGSGVFTVSRSSASKPNNTSNYVYKIETTTAKASFTGSEYVHTMYRLEGYDMVPFLNKKATFSFWVRSSVTGTYSMFFRSGSADASYVKEFTINTADTWEYKTIPVTINNSIGTWDYGSGLGLYIGFSPALGTTHATSTLGQWISGNYIGSTNQVNFAATVGNTFQLAQMQLELGSNASPYETLPIGILQELMNRYYINVGTIYINGTQIQTGTGNLYAAWDFPSPMRAAPTVATAVGAGTTRMWAGTWYDATGLQHSANHLRCLSTMQYTGVSTYVARAHGLMLMYGVTCDARI